MCDKTNEAKTMGIAAREMTVEELIDMRIEKLERDLKCLSGLKGALSRDFLRSGASRIGAFLTP